MLKQKINLYQLHSELQPRMNSKIIIFIWLCLLLIMMIYYFVEIASLNKNNKILETKNKQMEHIVKIYGNSETTSIPKLKEKIGINQTIIDQLASQGSNNKSISGYIESLTAASNIKLSGFRMEKNQHFYLSGMAQNPFEITQAVTVWQKNPLLKDVYFKGLKATANKTGSSIQFELLAE